MRILQISMFLLITFTLMMQIVPCQAKTYVWITISPSSAPPTPGSTFITDLNISSWNGVVGALDLTIHYDSAVLYIINFSSPPSSPFYPNCFADSASFTSGKTRITAFQVTDRETWETPVYLGIITWKVVAAAGSATNLTIELTSVVDINWSPVEVITYGQQISIVSEFPSVTILPLFMVLSILAAVLAKRKIRRK